MSSTITRTVRCPICGHPATAVVCFDETGRGDGTHVVAYRCPRSGCELDEYIVRDIIDVWDARPR
jgi:hypothetical protein